MKKAQNNTECYIRQSPYIGEPNVNVTYCHSRFLKKIVLFSKKRSKAVLFGCKTGLQARQLMRGHWLFGRTPSRRYHHTSEPLPSRFSGGTAVNIRPNS